MSATTNIQWTDVTDNIIIVEGGGWWCRMVSCGCAKCYAAKLNQSSFFGGNKLPYSGDPPKMVLRTDIIDSWARQTKPKKHFVASMTDVFGEWLRDEIIFQFLDAMCLAPLQTFQVLTKRVVRARDAIEAWLSLRGLTELPPNIWLGVSVEDQKRADERIPVLLSIPAKVRFLSVEPMLEPINLDLAMGWKAFREAEKLTSPILKNQLMSMSDVRGVDWVIVGGESGKNARPCNVKWIRSIVAQCKAASVPVFVKQLGSRPYAEDRIRCEWGMKHPKGGDPTEWPEDLRVREFPRV